MNWHELKIEPVSRDEIALVLPKVCSDMLMHWKNAWTLGNTLGEEAFKLPIKPTDPGQDEAEADVIRLAKCDGKAVIFYFLKPQQRFVWKRGAALVVAEKICVIAEEVAEEFETKNPTCRLFRK